MITPSDLITLPYTPDLTRAGIAYACRSLAYTYDRMGGTPYARLRRIVGGVAVELAFRRLLNKESVPHDVLGATHFTKPDRYDMSLGERRCDLKSFIITQKTRIRQLRRHPERLLDAQALVPVDQLASDHLSGKDLYIFSFLTALVTRGRGDLERALEAKQPLFLIHPFPQKWARPSPWRSLGKLAAKTDLTYETEIEVSGQDTRRAFMVEEVELQPQERVRVWRDFFAINYLSVPHLLNGRVGIHSPVLGEAYVVEPHYWGNIWVYGMETIVTGYMTRREFRRRAKRVPAGSRVFQYPRTRTENMAVPIRDLHPLSDLFSRARSWARQFKH